MNKIVILSLMLAIAVPTMAQDHRHNKDRHREIAEMVSDLSQSQKKKLDALTDASRKRVDALRMQKKAVRDSIDMYMKMDGDHSRELFPLFDREAKLQCEISREMYATKVRIDAVLTPQQRQQVRDAGQQPPRKPKNDKHGK